MGVAYFCPRRETERSQKPSSSRAENRVAYFCPMLESTFQSHSNDSPNPNS